MWLVVVVLAADFHVRAAREDFDVVVDQDFVGSQLFRQHLLQRLVVSRLECVQNLHVELVHRFYFVLVAHQLRVALFGAHLLEDD